MLSNNLCLSDLNRSKCPPTILPGLSPRNSPAMISRQSPKFLDDYKFQKPDTSGRAPVGPVLLGLFICVFYSGTHDIGLKLPTSKLFLPHPPPPKSKL